MADTPRYLGPVFAVMMCVAVLLIAWAAHGGEIADCAHDRFIEAFRSEKIVTTVEMRKSAEVAQRICLPSMAKDTERDEFDTGVDRAFVELFEEINSNKGVRQ